MKKSTKVVLFSLLVFPGAGHFLLRQWKWGLLFMIATLLPVVVIIDFAYEKADTIMERIINGEILLEPEAIRLAIYEKPNAEEAFLLGLSHVLLITCWLGSVAHSYSKARSC